MKSRNSLRRRRFLWAALTLPVATSKAAKKGCCAMPFVVVAVPCQGTSVRQFQIALRPFQGLDRWLLIDTENNRVFGRRHIKTDHIGGLCRKIRIVALAPALRPAQINLLFTQRPPNVLHIDVAQRPRDQWPVPARKPLGRRLVENFANALVGHLAIDRWGT